MFVVLIVVKIDVNILNISKSLLRFEIRESFESTTIRNARRTFRKIKTIEIIDNWRIDNRRNDDWRSDDWSARKRKFDDNKRIFRDALLVVRFHLSLEISTSNDLLLQAIQFIDEIIRINNDIFDD